MKRMTFVLFLLVFGRCLGQEKAVLLGAGNNLLSIELENVGETVLRDVHFLLTSLGEGKEVFCEDRVVEEMKPLSNTQIDLSIVIQRQPGWQERQALLTIEVDGKSAFSQTLLLRAAPPSQYQLQQNYPNPCNPETFISYSIPKNGENSVTSLIIYDTQGKEVSNLVNERKSPGNYTVRWNAKDGSGLSVASGVYYCRMKSGSFSETKKIIVVK